MRVAVVFSYPVYFDGLTPEQFFEREERECRAARILQQQGHEVELWGMGHQDAQSTVRMSDGNTFPVRLFAATHQSGNQDAHFSDGMVTHAKSFQADFHLLKGATGGVGKRLVDALLTPERWRYGFVIGGAYYSPAVPGAAIVLYESRFQSRRLEHVGMRRWRRPLAESQLMPWPKWINLDRFRPDASANKKWDVLVVGRLVRSGKDYRAVRALAASHRVAVVGGGPLLARLQKAVPHATWVGRVPRYELPHYINQSKVLVHTSFKEYFPRVLTEGMACGVPCVAINRTMESDVIPETAGLLVSRRQLPQQIAALLADPTRLQRLGRGARAHAEASFGDDALAAALRTMTERLSTET